MSAEVETQPTVRTSAKELSTLEISKFGPKGCTTVAARLAGTLRALLVRSARCLLASVSAAGVMLGGVPLWGASESHTEVRTEWLHAPEAWVVFLIIVPAVFLVSFLLYRGERGALTPTRRILLTVLRVMVVLAIIVFLFEPTRVRETVQKETSYVLVLVDDSFSMGIEDRYTNVEFRQQLQGVLGDDFNIDSPRLSAVQRVFSRPQLAWLQRLREKGNVRVVSCSEGVRKLADLPRLEPDQLAGAAPVALPEIELRGKVTRVGDSLYEAVNDLRGETISAVVLFSDGRDNSSVLSPEEAATRLGKRGIPIHVVGVGNPEEPKDIRVFGLQIAEVVLTRDQVPVDFSLISEGYQGDRVRVTLKSRQRDRPGSTWRRVNVESGDRTVRLEGGGKTQTARLQFTPTEPGEYIFRVEVETLDGELFTDNNAQEKQVTVLDEQIRVLYVDGPPRWEYRFLTWAITRDPTMLSQSLLISADAEFPQESSPGIDPVREFPLSREALFENYDVVIIGDIAENTLSRDQKEWLVEFVEEHGGGMVFVAGPGHMPQKYSGDPLERLFPVELETRLPEGSNSGYFSKEFHVRLTPEGYEHPVMQLVGDPEQNRLLWQRGHHSALPGFYWYAPVKGLKRGGVALAVHEEDKNLKLEPRPILAYQQVGRGRTLISLVDSTWRWRQWVGNKWFYRFWGQVVRFVSIGRLLGETPRFTVATDQREYTLGSTVRVQARVLDREFKPTREEERTLFWAPEGAPAGERREINVTQLPARPEYYESVIEARELGSHKVWLEERGQEVASTSYRVLVPQLEYAEPRMDRPRLEQVAHLSGGSYSELPQVAQIPDRIDLYERPIPISSESTSLWDTPWFLLLFVAIIVIEWILRKAFRLQ